MTDSGLSENDPYRGMKTGDDEIRPGFLSGVRDWEPGEAYRLNGESYGRDGKRIKKRRAAGETLGAGEKAAAGEGSEFSNNLSGMRERESTAPGIINSVKGKSSKDGGGRSRFGGKGKLKGKGFLKKAGPIAIIGVIFAVVAGIMVGAQNVMPIAIEEMIIEKFNSVGISSTMASDEWLDTQLNQGVRQGNPKSNEPETIYAFSEYQVQQFKKYGITVVNGDGVTALLYEKDGQYVPVVGSAALDSMSEGEIIGKIQSASGLSNIGAPISAKEALADANFKNPYTTASKAWRGGASGWFDKIMSGITEPKLGITRNRWVRYVRRAAKSATEEFNKIAKSTSLEKTSDNGMDADYSEQAGEDQEGNMTGKDNEKLVNEGEIDDVELKNQNGPSENYDVSNNEVKNTEDVAQVEASLKSKALKAAAAAGEVANYGCAILEGVMSIYTQVSAYQSLQFLNLISGFLESVDKVKAGDDTGSPIHEYSTNLTTKADTVYDGQVVKGREDKTAMESAGMAWLFGKNSVIKADDPSVKNVNFENIMSTTSTLFENLGSTMEIYSQCGYVKAGAALADLVSTVVSVVPIIGGGVKLAQITFKAVAKAAIGVAVQAALYTIIPVAAKNLAKMMIKDAATEWFGEDLGNAMVSAPNKYLGGNGTSGGQSPGSEGKVMAYFGARDTVIAQEAEYQRTIRSPFDITSRYTFLGSLAYSIIPLAYSSGLMTNMSSMSSLVSSSAIAMLPTASAIDTNSVLHSQGSCDLLSSTGAVGDAFCNPYIITDVSTMETSPVAVNDIVRKIGGDTTIASVDGKVAELGDNFNSDGSINKDSELAKYITYCGQRTSQYGIKDANIAEQVTGSNTTVSKIIGVTPGLNNIQDIVQGISDQVNLSWSNGSACVASSDNQDWENKYKWYQRYAENERLLENINPGYTSEVTAYLDDYYTENPLDQSLEGTLARFTGMTKEKVEDTFALIEYFEFLDEYDATERYAFGKPVVEEEKELRFDNENSVAENMWIVLLNQISYADVRNRSFAA